ncbi:MAG: hypothetical protein JO041_00950 [Acidobacteria bacterium]|nr:hypothetical protein [Acidobacteriota bacterium]
MRAGKLIFICVALIGAAAAQTTRAIGTVTAISGATITLKSDTGAEMAITVPDSARILRTQPGQRDLASASPIELKDVQVGDRMLVQGSSSGGGVQASRIIVMARSDIAQKQQQEQQAWSRGTGGIVTAVDPAASAITVSSMPGTSVTIHVTPQTVIRRYSPSSVKFTDAQPSSLADIQKGDQIRARGTRAAEGREFNADEIVSGSFRNIAGLVTVVDAAAGTFTVNDILGRKLITLKITGDSQMHKLQPMMAQMIARMAHSEAGGAQGGPNGAGAPSRPAAAAPASEPGMRMGGGAGTAAGGGRPDFQTMLNRTPAITVADIQKGDAVMLVATQGAAGQDSTVITLVAGVEPILTAAPSGSAAAALLSSWNMAAGPAEP